MTASIQLKFYIFVLLFQKLVGLIPYRYNNLKKKFVTNNWDFIYPVLIMLSYTYLYYMWDSAIATSPVHIWISYGRLSTFLLSWFVHCAHKNSIVKFFNAGFHLNDILHRLPDVKGLKITPTLLKAGIVTVVNSIAEFFAISAMVVFYKNVVTSEDEKIILTYGLIFFTFVIQSAIPMNFYGMTLIGKFYFKKLNHSKYENAFATGS